MSWFRHKEKSAGHNEKLERIFAVLSSAHDSLNMAILEKVIEARELEKREESSNMNLVPLFEAQSIFDDMITAKIIRFLTEWLPGIEKIMDDKGLEANVYVVFDEPYTEGGPFAKVPKAILTAKVEIKGKFHPKPEEPRRGMTLGLQNMQSWPVIEVAAARCENRLIWFSQPESYYMPGN